MRQGAAAPSRDANLAEARRVLDLSARHQLAFVYTADGWQMVDGDALMASLPPMADELALVAS